MIVVVPSNRHVELAHLEPLIESGARFVIVDDSEGTIDVDHPAVSIYTWGDRRRVLGPLDRAFPRRNGACRDFGFLMAWRESDPGETIVALDDDCRVSAADFAAQVERVLSATPRPIATSSQQHVNILDLYAENEPEHYPRGFPYSERVHPGTVQFTDGHHGDVTFSVGLWTGIWDINAVDKVTGRRHAFPAARLRHPSVVVAPGKLVSVCAMNMQFRRELVPAAYQLPMHVEVIPDGVIDRYGDIWGGFILKMLMDLRGEAMAVGAPMIEHLKEGDYVRNTWQENLGHQLNDEFLSLLAEAREHIVPGSYLGMLGELADHLAARAGSCSPLLRRYFAALAPALGAWIRALEATPA